MRVSKVSRPNSIEVGARNETTGEKLTLRYLTYRASTAPSSSPTSSMNDLRTFFWTTTRSSGTAYRSGRSTGVGEGDLRLRLDMAFLRGEGREGVCLSRCRGGGALVGVRWGRWEAGGVASESDGEGAAAGRALIGVRTGMDLFEGGLWVMDTRREARSDRDKTPGELEAEEVEEDEVEAEARSRR